MSIATRPQSCVLSTGVDRMLDGAAAVAVFVFNATALFVLVAYIVPHTDTCTRTSTWFVGTTECVCFLSNTALGINASQTIKVKRKIYF